MAYLLGNVGFNLGRFCQIYRLGVVVVKTQVYGLLPISDE